MKSKTDEVALLKKQLANTQRLLQHEQLKREVLEIMINIAEKELEIPIRKKLGRVGGLTQTVNQLSLRHPLVSMETLCGLFDGPPLRGKPSGLV